MMSAPIIPSSFITPFFILFFFFFSSVRIFFLSFWAFFSFLSCLSSFAGWQGGCTWTSDDGMRKCMVTNEDWNDDRTLSVIVYEF